MGWLKVTQMPGNRLSFIVFYVRLNIVRNQQVNIKKDTDYA